LYSALCQKLLIHLDSNWACEAAKSCQGFLFLTCPNPAEVSQKLGFSKGVHAATRWDPESMNDGEKGGFRTGCPVFTDLWSYVLVLLLHKHI
jgi:hypothetical protein